MCVCVSERCSNGHVEAGIGIEARRKRVGKQRTNRKKEDGVKREEECNQDKRVRG